MDDVQLSKFTLAVLKRKDQSLEEAGKDKKLEISTSFRIPGQETRSGSELSGFETERVANKQGDHHG